MSKRPPPEALGTAPPPFHAESTRAQRAAPPAHSGPQLDAAALEKRAARAARRQDTGPALDGVSHMFAAAEKRAARAERRQQAAGADHFGAAAPLFGDANRFETVDSAVHSVLKPDTSGLSKNQTKKAMQGWNQQVRASVQSVLDPMIASGEVRSSSVKDTYQSSHDHGNDFGGETDISGLYGDKYVFHGHYDEHGAVKPGSMGMKVAADPLGQRVAHGIDDRSAGSQAALTASETRRKSGGTP